MQCEYSSCHVSCVIPVVCQNIFEILNFGIFFDRLNPTEKEKDTPEYELELARLALAKHAKGDSDAQKFNTLKWREEARTAAKRHHVEDGRTDEIVKKKRLAVKAVRNDADGSDGSEAEVDEEPQETTPAQIVHLPDPKPVYVHFCSFDFDLFFNLSIQIPKSKI